MLQFDPAGASDSRAGAHPPLTLYIEGPRDRGILRAWAYRLIPKLAPRIFRASVILGGRQPARAIEHFRESGGSPGLCVLDRDNGAPVSASEPGLEFFTWSRRHIESYLLVPEAIRRALKLAPEDRRVERALDGKLPTPEDEAAWRELDAKHLLRPRGELAEVFGRALPLARIARVTREPELHADVHAIFERVRALSQVRP